MTVTQARTSSLASSVHTYRGTIPDPGEPAFDLWWDPTDLVHIFVRDLAYTPANGPNNFKWTYNVTNGANSIASANVSGFKGPDAGDVEENLKASFTVKITGAQTPSPA